MPLPLTVILLAGGASRRMGRDKALLRIRGRRAVDLLAGHYAHLARTVLVASGRRRIPRLKFPQISDPEGLRGPLAGLEAGLEASRGSWILLVACDQVPLNREALGQLWKARKGVRAVRLEDGPLPGLYPRALLPRIRRLRKQGLGPSALPYRMIPSPDGWVRTGWNTPKELSRWLRTRLPLE